MTSWPAELPGAVGLAGIAGAVAGCCGCCGCWAYGFGYGFPPVAGPAVQRPAVRQLGAGDEVPAAQHVVHPFAELDPLTLGVFRRQREPVRRRVLNLRRLQQLVDLPA